MYDCDQCDSKLQFESSLVRHYKEVHKRPVDPADRGKRAVLCCSFLQLLFI